jgi:hypothetical protein
MGGSGSGTYYRFSAKDTVESCRSIDVRELKKGGWLEPGQISSWTWTRWNGSTNSISIWAKAGRVVLKYRSKACHETEWTDIEEPISLEWTTCHFGGSRPWFVCPGRSCGRRVAELYLDHYFLCRHCLNLAYKSTRDNNIWRLISKAQKIRKRLGGSASLIEPFPCKPKGMWWRTYERLRQEASLYELVGCHAQARQLGIIIDD